MIGEQISPILEVIEDTLIEFESGNPPPPGYTTGGFRAATKIFMSALMDKMWELQVDDKMEWRSREQMATQAGADVRKLIRIYTGMDTFDFYK